MPANSLQDQPQVESKHKREELEVGMFRLIRTVLDRQYTTPYLRTVSIRGERPKLEVETDPAISRNHHFLMFPLEPGLSVRSQPASPARMVLPFCSGWNASQVFGWVSCGLGAP